MSFPPTHFEKAPSRSNRWGSGAKYLLLIVAGLCAIAVWRHIARQRAAVQAVQALPVENREQLYRRILENLRFCQAQSTDAFEDFCSSESEFVRAFPECDRECDELARPTPRPTR